MRRHISYSQKVMAEVILKNVKKVYPHSETKKTQVYISEELAAPFECWEKVGY